MSDHDAFEEEMLFRTLSDQDVERLLRGHSPEENRFIEVAEFTQTLRQALPASPVKDESDLVRKLAQTARSASLAGETAVPIAQSGPRAGTHRIAPRFAAVARAAGVLALVPLLFAGLAFAHVTLPEPARKAFEAVGVNLPNQPATDKQASEGTGSAAGENEDETSPILGNNSGKGQANAAEKRKHGTAKANPARAAGRGNGEQGRGRALGKRGLAPGRLEPPGQTRAPGQLKKDGGGKAVEKSEPPPPTTSSKQSTPPGQTKPAKEPAGSGNSP